MLLILLLHHPEGCLDTQQLTD